MKKLIIIILMLLFPITVIALWIIPNHRRDNIINFLIS